jgi:hypothetical protein
LLSIGEIIMKDFCGLLVALALAAGLATLVTTHQTAALPIAADYSGASF